MTDVAAAIRAKLTNEYANEACLGGCGTEGCRCTVYGFEEMRDALLAVLKTHAAWKVGDPDDPEYICQTCRYYTSEYPCPTLYDIATAFGVDCG
jgi:hypothetical protein